MLGRLPARALPVVNRSEDVTPAAQACCGVCRTCMTSNVIALVAAGVTVATARVLALTKRPVARFNR